MTRRSGRLVTWKTGPVWLTLQQLVWLHAEAMARSDDVARPIARAEALEGALARARHAFLYEDADLLEQAALVGVSVSQAQGFEDGNKRTAHLATQAFLRLNGA